MSLNIGIIGATGNVGREMIKVLEERSFPLTSLKLFADRADAGKVIGYKGEKITVEEAKENSFKGTDILLSAVEENISRIFTPMAVKEGAVVIDNSSAYRMDENVPLVIPEVNPEDIEKHNGIISNPNCTTIIALTAVAPLYRYRKIKSMVVSTYQAVSGAGSGGIPELLEGTKAYFEGKEAENKVFGHKIAFNLIPHIDAFLPNGYTKEEIKLTNEAKKILHNDELKINCTCVRVPVLRSHSESINLHFDEKVEVNTAREVLASAPGVYLCDDIENNIYPMPLDTTDQDNVFVGRIREDITDEKGLSLFVCGDQLRKGAATNAVQIAEILLKKKM